MENVILNATSSATGQLPGQLGQFVGLPIVAGITALTLILIIWSLAWKGLALWKAARLGQKWWFIILLVINTVGILEIIYIYFVARKKENKGGTPGSAPATPSV